MPLPDSRQILEPGLLADGQIHRLICPSQIEGCAMPNGDACCGGRVGRVGDVTAMCRNCGSCDQSALNLGDFDVGMRR